MYSCLGLLWGVSSDASLSMRASVNGVDTQRNALLLSNFKEQKASRDSLVSIASFEGSAQAPLGIAEGLQVVIPLASCQDFLQRLSAVPRPESRRSCVQS